MSSYSLTKFRWIILILFLVFLTPMGFAWFFYTHKTWLPAHTVNHGHLLAPPLSLQQLALDPTITQHHWVLLFIPAGECRDTGCQKNLYNMRQIQRALGKDQLRLARVLLTTGKIDAHLQQRLQRDGVWHWWVERETLTRAFGQPATWYLIDPLGNIVLNYAADADPEDILNDLQRLMRVSSFE